MVFVLSFVFAGCAMTPSVKEDKELEALVVALVEHNVKMEEKRKKRLSKGIRKLSVSKSGDDFVVSADLHEALIRETLHRILDGTDIRYMVDDVSASGKITARFEDYPLLKALNVILKPILLHAEKSGDMVVVSSGVEEAEDDANINAEVRMSNIGMDDATALLEGLYQPDSDGVRALGFGPIVSSNTVFLRGPKNEVAKAAQVLMKADQEVRHVVIEVLVVEFSSGDLEYLGSRLRSFRDDKFEDINVDFSGMSPEAISFSKLAVDDSYPNHLTSFTAILDLLISDEKARLISRPYISTMSGKEARISIGAQRYVIVNKEDTSSAEPIDSGVILEITPVVLGENNLRMAVRVEDSQFSNVNISGVSTEVKKNEAETIMNVQDGETIIIGGLYLNRKAWANSGFPFLRHIPGLNLLFGSEENYAEDREVAIYITPHIWEPEMLSPMIGTEKMGIQDGDGSFFDKFK